MGKNKKNKNKQGDGNDPPQGQPGQAHTQGQQSQAPTQGHQGQGQRQGQPGQGPTHGQQGQGPRQGQQGQAAPHGQDSRPRPFQSKQGQGQEQQGQRPPQGQGPRQQQGHGQQQKQHHRQEHPPTALAQQQPTTGFVWGQPAPSAQPPQAPAQKLQQQGQGQQKGQGPSHGQQRQGSAQRPQGQSQEQQGQRPPQAPAQKPQQQAQPQVRPKDPPQPREQPKPQQSEELRQTPPKSPEKALKIVGQKPKTGLWPILTLAKPKFGIRGAPCKLDTNYLILNLDKLANTAYHYDVRFDPERPKKLLPLIFEQFRVQFFPKYSMAFDGANNCYTREKLNMKGNILESEVTYGDGETGRDRTYKVTIKETDNIAIDLAAVKKYFMTNTSEKPGRAVQVLEVVLRMAFQNLHGGTAVGRSYYTKPQRPESLGEGWELWNGLFQSVILGNRPYLNVDISNKGFPSGDHVLNTIRSIEGGDINPNRELDQRTVRTLETRLKRLNICYRVPNRTTSTIYRYNGLKASARTQTFNVDGKKMTIEEYFKNLNIPLKYPHLPCLWVGPEIKCIYVPPEFCTIQEGQAINLKLSPRQTSGMIKFTAGSTTDRRQKIMNLLSKIQHNKNNVVRDFGIQIGDTFQNIEARVLNPPKVVYKNNVEIGVREGAWNMGSAKFLDAKPLTKWSVLVVEDRFQMSVATRFAEMIATAGRQLDMNIEQRYERIEMLSTRAKDREFDDIINKYKSQKIELLFVVVSSYIDVYSKIKQAAELRCGMITQCVKGDTLNRRLNGSTVSNILLKVNAKLNGTNHKIRDGDIPPLFRGKVMLVGADVTHPAGNRTDPSVVGVTASHDINQFQYNPCYRLQLPTQEMITDLKDIFLEQLRYYKSKTGNQLPDKIFYYRDGVSDGQFETVLSIELAQIYAACGQISSGYKPAVTFIVVQKRHHTRFFPTDRNFSQGRNNNVLPGTVVDKAIIDPKQYQFFLVSHIALQGVAKPTKYCILHDDSNSDPDQLQAATYNLCHMFSRCNRSVSYVAPTYYAHHAAARGKVYITGQNIILNQLDREFSKRQILPQIIRDNPMFFV